MLVFVLMQPDLEAFMKFCSIWVHIGFLKEEFVRAILTEQSSPKTTNSGRDLRVRSTSYAFRSGCKSGDLDIPFEDINYDELNNCFYVVNNGN